jgi:photosystem II stability/assembly factor-like uncharacterized protein
MGGAVSRTPARMGDSLGRWRRDVFLTASDQRQVWPPPAFQLSSLASDTSDGPFRDRLYFACRQSVGGPAVVTTSSDGGQNWARPSIAIGSDRLDPDARRVMTVAVNSKRVAAVMVVEHRAETGDGCLVGRFLRVD